jgi:hypothetical protein
LLDLGRAQVSFSQIIGEGYAFNQGKSQDSIFMLL